MSPFGMNALRKIKIHLKQVLQRIIRPIAIREGLVPHEFPKIEVITCWMNSPNLFHRTRRLRNPCIEREQEIVELPPMPKD